MNEKRQHLVATALQLFYQKGINSVGINELLKSAGVAKRTLYLHFASKEELALAALQVRHQVFIDWLVHNLSGATSDLDLIQKLFTALNGWFSNTDSTLGHFRGCLFINTLAELGEQDSPLTQQCVAHKLEVKKVIAEHMSKPSPQLLEAIFTMQEGAIVSATMSNNRPQIIENCIASLTIIANHAK